MLWFKYSQHSALSYLNGIHGSPLLISSTHPHFNAPPKRSSITLRPSQLTKHFEPARKITEIDLRPLMRPICNQHDKPLHNRVGEKAYGSYVVCGSKVGD
ncbi:hypothetical protein ACE6H2_019017 [Prunus campanulata]